MTADKRPRIILGITGATGMLYLPPFLRLLAAQQVEVHGIVSEAGRKVLQFELGVQPEHLAPVSRWFSHDDFFAPPASGSSLYDAMVVLPCSMGSLAAIARGYCANLLHRCADVTLKERRPLLLAVRETPLNRTHLSNMLAAHDAGATICPPMPSFYHSPQTLEDLARHFGARLCDLLGVSVDETEVKRWAQEG
ncbi:UbiX family flavin prenyltransferase [Desulfobulbus oligotrophicus]|jgi:4-hydroxy-3-polyprenylbenzoate decarboxylase|uniref:Flavin prenyltransferase UbiX n=1 Tax=Desulfobulbus oligotrophicus TaxID=1909699 RepID=A0A7T6AQX1_9BACT|nr:UbiX family flavin prenyltransferase [Desulfobulbus oligotrophicus]MDY0390254.1 UbiX family flavin prenyltransferase [Desulfobulbus oligotrophicus]QQG66248.1 UbiX family flavin prenyltransferase [Desulfobulbus oligotrophicus]